MTRIALTLLVLLGAAWPGRAMPQTATVRVGSEYGLWFHNQPEGQNRTDQFRVPVDVSWRLSSPHLLRAGGSFARSERGWAGRVASLSAPGELHGAVESNLWGDRLRFAVGGRLAFQGEGLTADEAWVAEALETTGFDFPLADLAADNRVDIHAAGQLIRRRDLLVQLGTGFEFRGTYDLRPGEQRFAPGDLWTTGGSAQAVRGSFRPECSLQYRRTGTNRLPSAVSFRPGAQFVARLATDWHATPGWRARVQAGLLSREHGATSGQAPLEESALGAGHVGNLGLVLARDARTWGAELVLGGTRIRGFAGELGHAAWFEPGCDLYRAWAGGTIHAGVRAPTGKGRSRSNAHGQWFSLSWSGGFGR
jgi:hypothetical protein